MVVIGAGRIGRALALRAANAGQPCTLVGREEGWDALERTPGPIVLAVRNDDLDAVVDRVPSYRHGDLVFVQNGMLRPWLAERGLSGNTRGLLYVAVSQRGTPGEPGQPSPFTGPHAAPVAGWLTSLGFPAWSVDWPHFSMYELEKLLWIATFGLLSERFGCTVGEVATEHRDTVTALVDELRVVGRRHLGVDLPLEALVQRLCDYSMTVADFRGSVKEWRWRNGWFVQAARHPMPVHAELLAAVGRRVD